MIGWHLWINSGTFVLAHSTRLSEVGSIHTYPPHRNSCRIQGRLLIQICFFPKNSLCVLCHQKILDGLRAKNHTVVGIDSLAVTESIRNRCPLVSSTDVACIEAVSDGRKGGTPDGYVSQTIVATPIRTTGDSRMAARGVVTDKPGNSAILERCTGVFWLICSTGLLIRVSS